MDFFEIMLQQKLAGGDSDVKVNSLSVTENGTYTALPGHAFSPVNVSVPIGVFPSGTSDITSNGIYSVVDFASVNVSVPGIIPSGTSSITANGIYDITSFASVDVNVSDGGGGGITVDDIAMRTISGAISGSATSIDNYAFYSCSALTTANFPNVTSIYDNAFAGCSALTTANFPNATSIFNDAFAYCDALTTANFPNVIKIGSSAFYYCTNITTANFPSVTSIGNSAFYTCVSLTTISFPNVTSIGSGAFYNCSALTTLNFPNVTSIGSSAFYYCTNVTTISFPKVRSIGSSAFYNCTSLMSAYCLASSLATLGSNAFGNTPMSDSTYTGSFGSIYVPASLLDSYKTATRWSAYADRITAYEGE